MASSPAFEFLSQRFASRCSLSVKLGRRHASTSSEGAAAATAAATATSHEISRNVEFLRTDIAKRRNVQRIWQRLNVLNDLSPSSIPADLLAASIPILSKSYDKRLAVQHRALPREEGQERYIKVQEMAETLYARYRFICNYLENNGWKPLSPKSAFGWAKAFEELGYAPAAWRIWEDRKRLADMSDSEDTKKGEDGLKYLADSVLVASLRYLKLRTGAVDQQSIRIQVQEATLPILEYLHQTEQYDSISRSLQIRLIRGWSDIPHTESAISQLFGFNFTFPAQSTSLPFASTSSLSYSSSSSGVPTSRSTSRQSWENGEIVMDRHTLNTIMGMHAENNDLSGMISTFEAAVYPLSPAAFPTRPAADQNSFFFANRPWPATSTATSNASNDFFGTSFATSTGVESPEDQTSESQDVEAVAGGEEGVASTPELHYRPSMNLTSVNAHTFEILIETATKLGCISIAIHYVRELFSAWQQERSRLRAAHSSLVAWQPTTKIKREKAAEELPSLAELGKIPASTIGISIHPIYTVYNSMKYGRHERQRRYPQLASLVAETERILALIQEDVEFWSEILDKKHRLRMIQEVRAFHAGQRQQVASAAADIEGEDIPSPVVITGAEEPFSSKVHLKLVKRNEIEVDELLRQMQVRAADLLSQRQARAIISILNRALAVPDDLALAIRRAEKWLIQDEEQDALRLAGIEEMRHYSDIQRRGRLHLAGRRFRRRRLVVRDTLDKAREAARTIVEGEEARIKAAREAQMETMAGPSSSSGSAEEMQPQDHQYNGMSASANSQAGLPRILAFL